MNEAQIIGYIVLAIITIGAFVAVILKMTQPINDLRVAIQELKDCISSLKTDISTQNKRLDKHGDEIEKLTNRVGNIETRIDIYHPK